MSTPGEPFGDTPDGYSTRLYTLENSALRVRITDFGGRIVSLEMRESEGGWFDALLGFDDAAQYAKAGGAFGALLGRNANRIARGELTIDGRQYRLAANDRGATLHGGPKGFDMVLWQGRAGGSDELLLAYVSPDGDQGFPRELRVEAHYRLRGAALLLELRAETSAPTVVSLSAHPYFNLAGAASGDILNHEVTIAADRFPPTDPTQIPTGKIRAVDGTPFVFRQPAAIGARIRRADPQLLNGQGYDHYYVLGSQTGPEQQVAARARDPRSGRYVEIHTTQPGLQFYSGNQLNGSVAGRGGGIYRQSAGVAFEPQGFPDAPHHPNFPTTVLRHGAYREVIEYRFGTE